MAQACRQSSAKSINQKATLLGVDGGCRRPLSAIIIGGASRQRSHSAKT